MGWHWASKFTSLHHSCHICKLGIIIASSRMHEKNQSMLGKRSVVGGTPFSSFWHMGNVALGILRLTLDKHLDPLSYRRRPDYIISVQKESVSWGFSCPAHVYIHLPCADGKTMPSTLSKIMCFWESELIANTCSGDVMKCGTWDKKSCIGRSHRALETQRAIKMQFSDELKFNLSPTPYHRLDQIILNWGGPVLINTRAVPLENYIPYLILSPLLCFLCYHPSKVNNRTLLFIKSFLWNIKELTRNNSSSLMLLPGDCSTRRTGHLSSLLTPALWEGRCLSWLTGRQCSVVVTLMGKQDLSHGVGIVSSPRLLSQPLEDLYSCGDSFYVSTQKAYLDEINLNWWTLGETDCPP